MYCFCFEYHDFEEFGRQSNNISLFYTLVGTSLQSTTTAGSSGFGLGGGLKLGTLTTSAPTLGAGLGGFGLTTSIASTLGGGGSIFGQSVAKTTSSGLGGVDPKTTTTTTSESGKPG